MVLVLVEAAPPRRWPRPVAIGVHGLSRVTTRRCVIHHCDAPTRFSFLRELGADSQCLLTHKQRLQWSREDYYLPYVARDVSLCKTITK